MRDYGKVYSRFWSSRDMRALSEDGRYLALYLMTCAHCTLAGICHLPDGYVCEDIQWTAERVSRGFAELHRKGFATRCVETKWVWITKFLEWNALENPNQSKAAAKILEQVPDECSWRSDFVAMFEAFMQTHAKPFRKGSATVREPLPKGSPTVREGLANGSGTVSKPVTVTVSGSGSVTGTVPGAVTVPFAAEADGETAEPCVSGCEGATKPEPEPEPERLNGHGHANGHDPPPTTAEPKAFTQLREIYPERAGDPRWTEALEQYRANLDEGITSQQMLNGVMRYARYCKAEGLTGTKFVQAPLTFLGRNRAFLEAWKPSEKPKRETPGERWARESSEREAGNDASH